MIAAALTGTPLACRLPLARQRQPRAAKPSLSLPLFQPQTVAVLYHDLDAIPSGPDAPPLFTPPYVELPVDGAVAVASCPLLGHVAVATLRNVYLLRVERAQTVTVTPLMQFTALVPVRMLAVCLDTVAYASQSQVSYRCPAAPILWWCLVLREGGCFFFDLLPFFLQKLLFLQRLTITAPHPPSPPSKLHVVRFDLVQSGDANGSPQAPSEHVAQAAELGDVEIDEDELVCGFDEMGVPWRHLRSQVLELPSLEGGGAVERLLGDDLTYGPLRYVPTARATLRQLGLQAAALLSTRIVSSPCTPALLPFACPHRLLDLKAEALLPGLSVPSSYLMLRHCLEEENSINGLQLFPVLDITPDIVLHAEVGSSAAWRLGWLLKASFSSSSPP